MNPSFFRWRDALVLLCACCAALAAHAQVPGQEEFKKGQAEDARLKHEAALPWYRKAAELGHCQGMANVAVSYEFGVGYEQSNAEATSWYRKALEACTKAANNGDPDAMWILGRLYKDKPDVVPSDPAQSTKWYGGALKSYQKSADAGDVDSALRVAAMYHSGQGAASDDAEAAKWYRKALDLYRKDADAGNDEAMVNIGLAYDLGNGVDKDPKEAMKWYQKAAVKGNKKAIDLIKQERELDKLQRDVEDIEKHKDDPLRVDESKGGLGYQRTH
jgi:TPR repeat protein